jgi:hypothetical protein
MIQRRPIGGRILKLQSPVAGMTLLNVPECLIYPRSRRLPHHPQDGPQRHLREIRAAPLPGWRPRGRSHQADSQPTLSSLHGARNKTVLFRLYRFIPCLEQF